jgi:hypothetical protein
MSYSDPRYQARRPVHLFDGVTSTFTYTASDHVDTLSNVARAQFIRACVLTGARALTTTDEASAVTGEIAVLMRGTNTLGSITLATATAGAQDITLSNNTFTAGEEIGINLISTGTASETVVTSIFDLIVEYNEQFA